MKRAGLLADTGESPDMALHITAISRTAALPMVLWLAAGAGGLAALSAYAYAAGPTTPAPASWPGETDLGPLNGAPAVVFFAHPRCPCTRASLAEFERALAMTTREPALHFVFFTKPGEPDGWAHTDLWRRAQRLRGAVLHRDPGGAIAERFGVTTSGDVMYFDSAGVRRFRGGVTSARSHEGNNDGRTALAALLQGKTSPVSTTPVYGCAISCSDGPETDR